MKAKLIKIIRSNKFLFNISSKLANLYHPKKNKYHDDYIYRVYYLDKLANIKKIMNHFQKNFKDNYKLVIMVDEKNYANINQIVNNYHVSIITATNYHKLTKKNYKLVTLDK